MMHFTVILFEFYLIQKKKEKEKKSWVSTLAYLVLIFCLSYSRKILQ